MFGIHEWIYGSLLLLNDKAYICPDKAAAWNMTQYEVIPETVGQFIGLYDRGGREIYEGDIVEHTYYHSKRIVEWRKEQSQFDGWYKSEEKYYLIHGNIYNNPELIDTNQ